MAKENNLFKRLTTLFRSGPVVKRKVRNIDTRVAMPDSKSSAVGIFQKSTSPTYSFITANAYTLQERLARYADFNEMEYSLMSSTQIASTDGNFVEIGELANLCEANPDYTFPVYSYNHESQTLVVAIGKQARKTRTDHAWTVTFDNGQSITGSANHRLMLRDGSYKMIEDLRQGDAMMPFNRRKIDGYHRIYTMDKENSKSGWQTEHKLVAEKVLGRKLEKNEVVHHINFVRNDNRPENLHVMTDEEHQKLHRVNVERLNEQKWSIENKEWIEKFKSDHSTRMRLQNPAFSGITFEHIVNAAEKAQFSLQETLQLLEISNQQFHRLLAQNGFKNFQTLVNAYRNNDVRQTVTIKGVTELFVRDLDCIDQLDTKNSASVKLQCSVNVLDKFLMTRCHTSWIDFRRSKGWELTEFQHGGRPRKQFDSQNSVYQLICNTYTNGLSLSRLVQKTRLTTSRVMKYVHQAGFKNFKTWTESYRNHKVVSIEYAGVMDLYDLTVDGYKNFATDTVISHNTAEINSALDIYADETVAQDEKGRSLHIYSNNPKIKVTLEDLYYNTLNVEFNMRPWIRNLPIHKDTVIPLLDGRNITIEQLSKEYDDGKENWVYSVQDKTLKTVPGKVAWCGLTRKNSELVRVWLDDDSYVDCTPDHEWVMRDGTQKRACALTPGESLMPFYRTISSKKSGDKIDGYERIYDAATEKYEYTHRLVASDCVKTEEEWHLVHHINFDKLNNEPQNLRKMTRSAHSKLHDEASKILQRDDVKIKRMAGEPNYFELIKSRLPRIASTPLFQHAEKKSVKLSGVVPEMRKKHSSNQTEYKNHKVARIETLEATSDVYCMEVLGANGEHDRHRFMTLTKKVNDDDVSSGICSANCKYGDFFLLNDVSPEHGVINVIPIPINEIEREEGYDKSDPQAVRFRWVTMGNRILENWEVTHMRLMGNDMFLPYGSSVLEGARRIWRQLVLIEDAMLVYRIVRSPERRVFYIDVGNSTPEEIPILMEQARTTLRSQQIIDKTTGRVDLRYNPLSVDEDYFIPVRGTESGTRIDTLQGGQNTATVEDVEYIQRKLFAALKVPKAYLGYDEALSSKATLAQEDIRFSRTISMIQRTVISELNKIAIIHLTANGWEGEDLLNFSLRLSNPSTVAQQQKLELYRTKFEIAGSVPEGLLSREWIQRNIIGLSSEEILQIERQLLDDAATAAAHESAAAIGAGGGGTGGGGGGGAGGAPPPGGDEVGAPPPPGDTGGGAPPPADEPPPENAGASEEEDRELMTSGDDLEQSGFRLSMKDDNAPIKAQNQLNRTLYNRGRRRTHGASKTHFPDFNKMVGNSKELNDPYDSESLNSFSSNPLGGPNESVNNSRYDFSSDLAFEVSRPVMSVDIDEMLRKMNHAFGRGEQSQALGSDGLITESVEIQNLDEIDVFIEDEKKGDE